MEEPTTSRRRRNAHEAEEEDDVEINVNIDEGEEDEEVENDKGAGKRKSMASAFAKILGKRAKGTAGPILAEGKILNKEEDKKAKELRKKILSNRKQRLEIREKGHVTAVKYGLNPEQDALERRLVRTTTKVRASPTRGRYLGSPFASGY